MKNKLISSMLFLLIGLGFGCKKDQGSLATADETITAKQQVTPIAYNPYSLENMRKAAASLLMKDVQLLTNNQAKYTHGKILFSNHAAELTIDKSLTAKESSKLAEKELLATHYYIKFMPANNADYAKLKADSNLIIYPFPLDAAVSKYSGNYRDPAVPAGVPTYQYASVPVTQVLPSVPFVKLVDLYLPDERTNAQPIIIKGAGNSSYAVSGRELVNESMCGGGDGEPGYDPIEEEVNEDDCDYGGGGPSTGPGAPPGEWKPSGRITMVDGTLGTIGVEGIRVRARRWFTTYTGITDANGDYHVDGTYTRPANYWLNFERYDFAVINNSAIIDGVMEISGPKQQGPWNLNITDTYEKYCATIFRAAFHFYYKDIQGLERPPQNSFLGVQLSIKAKPNASGGGHPGETSIGYPGLGIWETIRIFDQSRSSEEVYGTTIHELAHTAHYVFAHTSYTQNNNAQVNESWATGVQWVLTKMEYPNYRGRWCAPGGFEYKNVVMDMIDGEQLIAYPTTGYTNFGFTGSFYGAYDQVEGYTIKQIQDRLNWATSWNAWKNQIKTLTYNATDQHLDALFSAWDNY